MRTRILLVLGVLLLLAGSARAQGLDKYSGFVGAGFDGDTQFHPTGAAALVTGLADKTYSFSAVTIRGDVDGKPITTVIQGVLYEAFRLDRIALYASLNAQLAQSSSATTGGGSGGGLIGFMVRPNLEIIVGSLGQIAPAEPGENLKFIAGLRFIP